MGKLVLSSGFSLIDAMSAVELMDPKMDIGMKPIDQTLGLQNAIDNDGFNDRVFNMEEMIAIFDANFACIASSIDGAYFDQTVTFLLLFNFLYLTFTSFRYIQTYVFMIQN